jgi:hypothetical protein
MAMFCESKGVHITFSYLEPVIRIIPPLIITREDIDLAAEIIDEALTFLETSSQSLSHLDPKNKRSGPFVRRMKNPLSPVKIAQKFWNTSPRDFLRKVMTFLG